MVYVFSEDIRTPPSSPQALIWLLLKLKYIPGLSRNHWAGANTQGSAPAPTSDLRTELGGVCLLGYSFTSLPFPVAGLFCFICISASWFLWCCYLFLFLNPYFKKSPATLLLTFLSPSKMCVVVFLKEIQAIFFQGFYYYLYNQET